MNDLVKYDSNEVLALAENLAEQEMGSKMDDPSIPVAQRNALWRHKTFVTLGKIGQSAGHALREIASEMYVTKEYMDLKIPYDNDPNQFVRFENFRDWLNFAVAEAKLSAPVASTMAGFIENVVDPVAKRLIMHKDGRPFEVPELADLRENHVVRLASAAKQSLKRDPENYGAIADMLEVAQDPETTEDDMADYMRARSLSNRRVQPVECNVINLADETIYVIVMDNDAQKATINTGLNNRVTWRTRTIEDTLEFLESYIGNRNNVDSSSGVSVGSGNSPLPESNVGGIVSDKTNDGIPDIGVPDGQAVGRHSGQSEQASHEKVTARDFTNWLKDQA